MDPAIAATSGAAAANAAQEEECYWLLLKHQIKLSTGLLQSQYRRGNNLLLSPNMLISSLATLVPGKGTETRVELARTLFDSKCRSKMNSNQMIKIYCLVNKINWKKNTNALHVSNCHYSHPSQPIKPKFAKKLWKKYRATAKELEFVCEKPNLQALQTINADALNANLTSPMMSTAEYVNLIDWSTRTILSSAIHFNGLWSKSFDVQYGEFRKSTGEAIKTPLLVKNKSFLYHYDALTMAKVVKINCSHEGTLALVLILPDESISTDHYIHHMLSYDSLKRIFKKLTTRCDVQLTFPKFKLTSNQQLSKPMQQLALNEMLQQMEEKPSKKVTKCVPPVDDHVILVQKTTIEIQERGVDSKRMKTVSFFTRSEVEFIADRPFIFALVTSGRAQQIVMLGVCEDPRMEAC